jgi:hypothetical protein
VLTIAPGPGAKHVGINPPGLSFAFAVVEVGVIEELADSLGRRFRSPPHGSVSILAPLPQATAFGDTLTSFVQAAAASTTLQANQQDDVLYRATAVLSDDGPSRPIKRTRLMSKAAPPSGCRGFLFGWLLGAPNVAYANCFSRLRTAEHATEQDRYVEFSGGTTA